MLEPVEAPITVRGRGKASVTVLDHVGHRTRAAVPVKADGPDATFRIGSQYRAIYYEVTF